MKSLIEKLMRYPKIFLILSLILGGATLYVFLQYRRTQSELDKLKVNPKELAAIETKKVVDKVSQIMVLPKETPTLATVTDVNKLKTQPFFVNAQNGDKVLIYSFSKKAILYRPGANKIVEVSPVSIGSSASSEQSRESPKILGQ